MQDNLPRVWTILHEGDLIASEDTGMVPVFFSRQSAEYFMTQMGWSEGPTFRVIEMAVTEVDPAPKGKLFNVN